MRGAGSTLLFLSIFAPGFAVSQTATLFSDDFERPDAALVGNGWTEHEQSGGAVDISDGRLRFVDSSDLSLRPMVTHGFSEVVSGIVEWGFEFDWSRRSSETIYTVHMQLGDGSQMSDQSMDAGVGVNLEWGRINGVHEQLGFRLGGAETAIGDVSGSATVRVRADLDRFTYEVEVDGTVVLTQIPFDGTVALNTVRFFTHGVREQYFSGRAFDSLTIRAQESGSGSNRRPVANDDVYGVDQDALLTVSAPGVLSNDTDNDGDTLTASLLNGVSNGTLTLLADGSFSYLPNAGFSGTDSFTYLADDGTQYSATGATVAIDVRDASAAATPPTNGGGGTPPTTAPVILGAPRTAARADDYYYFRPSASDPDGDALQFTIRNKPAWLTFDQQTGELAGRPSLSDVRDYTQISISVSDGTHTVPLDPFDLSVVVSGPRAVTLEWAPPTENTDGSPLVSLSGFTIRFGPYEGFYPNSIDVDNPGVVSYLVDGLVPGKYYFVVTAYRQDGTESDVSNFVEASL